MTATSRDSITVQGRLTNPTGAPLESGQYPLCFRLCDSGNLPCTGDALLYEEEQSIFVNKGIYTANLGTGTVQQGSLDNLKTNEDVYLEVATGTPCASASPLAPRVPLASSAFAFRAKTADSADVAKNLDPAANLLVANGVFTGDMSVSGAAAFTGNVGIGTTGSTKNLDVTGQISANTFVGNGSGLTGISTGPWQGASPGPIYYNGGNVGIGTTGPARTLEVYGNVTLGAFSGRNSVVIAQGTVGIGGSYQADTSENYSLAVGAKSVGSDFNSLHTQGTTVLAALAGNVGIGTVSPGAKLDIAGQIKITGGAPGADKVLTSDASGLASWQTPAVSGVTLPSGAVFMMITGSCPVGTADVSATYSNKFIRVNATAGSTGGSDTVTLTEANLPSHTHAAGTLAANSDGAHTHMFEYTRYQSNDHGGASYHLSDPVTTLSSYRSTDNATPYLWTDSGASSATFRAKSSGAHIHSLSGSTGATGSGTAVTVTNPYVTVKMCQVN